MNYDDDVENGFRRWLDRIADELGVDRVSTEQAARLLGKSLTSCKAYAAGSRKPPRNVRLLMTAIAEGAKPRPWPI